MIYSLCVLKPDCVERELVEKCLEMITDHGLEIVMQDRKTLTLLEVRLFYYQCRKEPYFEDLCRHMTSGDCHGVVVAGRRAIERLNALVGFNEPQFSLPGTIRKMGHDIASNLAHSSQNIDQFLKEAMIFFSKEQVINLF
jgi:nucleoside-diphosphate kinase